MQTWDHEKAEIRLTALEAENESLRREVMALKLTLIRSGLSMNHSRVLEQDIQRRKQNA
jgi:hypothetical protein